jgi:CubicO group peptidase (beta-lactamase class C family)
LASLGLVDERQLDNDLVLQGLRKLSGPDAPAGVGYLYSNIGYVVLAELLAALTSTPVPVLAQRCLFRPLGMARSGLVVDELLSLREDVRPPRTLGDGGLWTSAHDLLVWLDALNHDRLGAELTRLVQSPGRLDDDTPVDYAWGTTVRNSPAGVSYTHGGNWPGWSAKTVRRPATDTAVVLLSTSNAVELVSRAAVELHDRLAPGDWA